MKRILLSLLVAMGLLVLPTSVATKTFPFLGSVRPLQMVNVEDGGLDNMCTTSSINEKKDYWITAAHCVLGMNEAGETVVEDRLIEGTRVFVTEYDRQLDLAVLTAPQMDVKAIKLASRQPLVGDKVLIAGHPFGYPSLFLTQGSVANLDSVLDGDPYDPTTQHFMVYEGAGAPGNSGSPVMNSKGEMISVLQIGWGRSFSPMMGGSTWRNLVRFAGKYFRA